MTISEAAAPTAVFDRLVEMARTDFDITAPIASTTTFEDLGLDSLDKVEFVLMVEDELGCSIEDNDIVGVTTLGQLAVVVEGKMTA